jgi:TRAP-type mannitol/chloroaromatic compound transport system permease small subunit
MKIVAILLLLAILVALGQALLRLIRGSSSQMWTMLAWRVGLSITLFVVLVIALTQRWL